MKNLLASLALLILVAGCTSADDAFTGSPHGYSGRVNTVWTDLNVVPTIIQDGESALQSDYGASGEMRDMPSTFEADAAGNLKATGVAAYLMALANLCARAPDAGVCGGPELP
jgi:hypothetical protein